MNFKMNLQPNFMAACIATALLLFVLPVPAQQTPVITPMPGASALPQAPQAPAEGLPALPSEGTAPINPVGALAPAVPNALASQPPLDLPLLAPQPAGPPLTLAEAEQLAVRANPRISAARLIALATGQVTRETRSADYPTITGALTAVDAHENSRVTAGALNNPILYTRAAGGVYGSALLTDFGRTRELIQAAHARDVAAQQNALATAADINLAVDQAFYRSLAAQAEVRVAQQTVATRQQSVDQIRALTEAKLRSTLDLSFVSVDLSQARLALLDADNEQSAAMNTLNALLGNDQFINYSLTDPDAQASTNPAAPPTEAAPLVAEAFAARPEIASARATEKAAEQFSKAEHKLYLPTISALGAAGGAPVRDDHILSSWYGAAGVNISIPVFNGFLFDARAKEADLRAQAATADVKAQRDAVARDVRQAVLDAQNSYERIAVSRQLLADANSSLDLAQTRYQLGLSSIVEYSQAQLSQTQAAISFISARYAYQSALLAVKYQTGQ
jgi:outer membrane protein